MNKANTGFGYFMQGFQIAFTPGIRRYVLLPLLANIILVGSAMYYLFSNLNAWIEGWLGYLPEFLSCLAISFGLC
ncbi:sulfate transporter [Vibrio variabilis]|uniref:Sulfate transporter n=1 Tax=Vibrio variabilis TaxID=990271 RepID=A0ABQ0JDR7_9VIBR|nr:sulfate transporter [Vibrio variabilis]